VAVTAEDGPVLRAAVVVEDDGHIHEFDSAMAR